MELERKTGLGGPRGFRGPRLSAAVAYWISTRWREAVARLFADASESLEGTAPHFGIIGELLAAPSDNTPVVTKSRRNGLCLPLP